MNWTPQGEIDTLFNRAMLLLAALPKAIFVGQNVEYGGVAMYASLNGVPAAQRLEVPVMEDMQLGMCAGMAMMGFVPVAIYPRFDFLILAVNQLVNHLDKLEEMSRGQWQPKVIVRTRVGTKKPLDAGPQHTQDHTKGLRHMLTNVGVLKIVSAADIMPAYREAAESRRSTVVVEAIGA